MYSGEDQGQYYADMGNAAQADAEENARAQAEMEHYQKSMKDMLMASPSTATSVDLFSDGVIKAVKQGELNPLAVAVQLKAMEQATERIRKEIKTELMTEVDKYPEKKFTFMGNEISRAEHGTRYDYKACQDPMWNELEQNRKDREAFLRALKAPLDYIDGDGVVHKILPPVKTSTSGINIKIQ